MSGSRSDDVPSIPNRDKGKAPQKGPLQFDLNDFPPSKRSRTDDQTERKLPRPNPRISYVLLGPKEGEFASRTLAPDEADPTSPVLRIINEYEHFVFLDIPSFIHIANIGYSVRYRVFGEEKREYETLLSRPFSRRSTDVIHFSDWDRIVRDHSLRAGDEVSFDRYLDTNISNDFFYILKYTRKPLLDGDDARKEVEDNQTVSEPSNVNVDNMSDGTESGYNVRYCRLVLQKVPDQEPGSRYLPPGAYCLTKTLHFFKATPSTACSLCLSLTDAVILTENPRIADLWVDDKYSKDMLVYDGENRKYRMTLYHNTGVWSNIRFFLGGEWINFVTRNKLKVGDRVMIYKILDASVTLGYYHVLRYVSTDFVPMRNYSVGAGGILLGPASDQRRNIPLAASRDKRRNIELSAAMDQIRNVTSSFADQRRRDIQMAALMHQRKNIPLAVVSDQRRNIHLAASGDQRGNIPLGAAMDQRRNIQLAVPEGPCSRSSMRLDYCITKTLDPRDVSEADSMLHLDALSEAIHLCEVPSPAPYPLGKDPKTLLVYDKDKKRYDMLLSHYATGDGVVTYTLGGGWQKFVRAHGLRAADKITIFRFSDSRGQHLVLIRLKRGI